MVNLAVPSTFFFCPLDLKYLFCDAPRVLDGPPGSPKFPCDHYVIGDIKSLLHLKNLGFLMSHPNSSVGLVKDLGAKGPGIETRCCQFLLQYCYFLQNGPKLAHFFSFKAMYSHRAKLGEVGTLSM